MRLLPPSLPSRLRTLTCVILSVGMALTAAGSCAAGELVRRDLSDGDKALIIGSSAAAFALGRLLVHPAADTLGPIATPPAIDRWFREHLHGGNSPKSNFLDNNRGSAATPIAALLVMGAIDIDRAEFSRDIPMFLSGIIATKGITDISKGLFGRTRPCCRAVRLGEYHDSRSHGRHSHSFFSGHASSAFFSSTFLNRRLRRHMRQNWTPDEYRIGRIVSPVLNFGWASFVGLSRIQADRHYFTDVAAGALVGMVLGELFFRLAYEESEGDAATAPAPVFLINIPLD